MLELLAADLPGPAGGAFTTRAGGVSPAPYDALGDEVRVTVIAAGFDAGAPTPVRRIETRRPAAVEDKPEPAPAPSYTPTPRPRPTSTPTPAASTPPRRTVVFEDDLDVPDFLK